MAKRDMTRQDAGIMAQIDAAYAACRNNHAIRCGCITGRTKGCTCGTVLRYIAKVNKHHKGTSI